ncbi:DUF1566 domain-containing protein [Candidatus Pacearchaeota archaeon]|nr:DUF1566 domain-containing protein [Candidatus Pacearchaeota archaeon]
MKGKKNIPVFMFLIFAVMFLHACGGSSSNSSNVTTTLDTKPVLTTTTSIGQYDIVDTDQTACYNSSTGVEVDCSGTGYDAAYSGNQPSYTESEDGLTVTDDVTGLIWTKNTDTDGTEGVDINDKLSQNDAVTYCENLELGGYTDWRLPDIKTLYSLILFSGKDASSEPQNCIDGSCNPIIETVGLTPFIAGSFDWAFGDQAVGERVIDSQYATTTNYVSTTMGGDATMFGVNFIDGRIKGYPLVDKRTDIDKTYFVRCVTGNTDYGLNNFVDNDDATITDLATGLMWQQDNGDSTDFDDAVSTCENITTSDYTDWRLPNAKELQSIVDYSRSPDTTGSAAIDPIFNAASFTNEEGENDWGYYWASSTHVDNENDGTNATYLSFGRALGYFESNILDVHGAGAQRSNDKADVVTGHNSTEVGDNGTFYYWGPQGDIARKANKVRCVRNL